MSEIKKVLCVCYDNRDRSPFMKGLLENMLKNQGTDTDGIEVDSAGTDLSIRGGPAPKLSVELGPTYGVDLSRYRRKSIGDLWVHGFDLVIAADKETMAAIVEKGYKKEIVCLELDGAKNAWRSQDPRKVEEMIWSISDALLRYVISYKFRK